MTQKKLLNIIVKAADEKRAEDITALNLEGMSSLCDAFVIASASNTRQLEAIAETILEKVKENGYATSPIEGDSKGGWLLLDLHDIVVHLFLEDERYHYNLEKLWHEAPIISLEPHLQ